MKSFLLVFLSFFCLSGFSQQWQLSGQSAPFPTNDLAARRFYVSVLDNNGRAVTGLKAENFEANGITCPNDPNACSFALLGHALPPIEVEPGLYNLLFRTKNNPSTVIVNTVFLKVFTVVRTPGVLPKFIQHGQVLLTPAN